MYISVTKVKEVISGVLAPVMQQAKKESDFVRKMNIKVEDIIAKVTENSNQIVSLSRTAKHVEDVQKQLHKFQGDFSNYQNVIDNTFRSTNTSIDTVRYDLGKTTRDHEADQLRIDRIAKVCEKMDRDFAAYQ